MMKAHNIALSALIFATGVSCNKQQTEASPVKGEAEVLAAADGEGKNASLQTRVAALLPRLGGSLVALGDHWLELAIHKNGLVEGLLFDKQGKLVDKPEAAQLDVKLHATGDARPEVDLKWDAPSGRYIANADTKAQLLPKPVEVAAKLNGQAKTATLTEYAVLPAPEFGGTVMSAGSYKTELIARPDGKLQAFVTDAGGAKLDGNAKAKLKARLGAKADQQVELDWDPAHACFVGKLDAGAKLQGEPVSVALDAGGQSHIGGVAKLPVTIAAQQEGAVVVAGEFPIELVAKADFLEAHVFDASGKAHAKGDLELRAFAGAEAFAGAKARKDLAFSWHAPGACYRAKLDAKLDLFSQPIRIELVNHGRLHAGAALSLNAVRSARLDADAKLAADAKLGADAKLTAAAKLPEIKARANLASGAKAKLDAAADAKAKAALDAKAKADAASKLSAKATVAIPKPKVEVKKSASANADTSKEGSAQAGVKAGFSLGTK